MHELTITEHILEIVLRHAQAVHATRITDIYLVIGQLSSIVDDSVQFYWDIISENTAAAGSRLHFHRIPTELACLACGQHYMPTNDDLACPVCGGFKVKIVSGEEFYLEAIDIAEVNQPTPTGAER